MTPEEQKAYSVIQANARKFPGIAVHAVMAGIEAALADLRDKLVEKDSAMMAAMILADTKRLDLETRRSMNEVVRRGINPKNASPAEKRWLEKDH